MASYLITGASGGIGTAICQRLAKDHNLVLVARNKDKLGELSRSLQGSHLT
ncbi:MAG: SDR family NAD(P)-dependent oxidoreductase, partial [Aestuariivirga sp.]